jgi:hypothetical protein
MKKAHTTSIIRESKSTRKQQGRSNRAEEKKKCILSDSRGDMAAQAQYIKPE